MKAADCTIRQWESEKVGRTGRTGAFEAHRRSSIPNRRTSWELQPDVSSSDRPDDGGTTTGRKGETQTPGGVLLDGGGGASPVCVTIMGEWGPFTLITGIERYESK
jgi:hypothetical protein